MLVTSKDLVTRAGRRLCGRGLQRHQHGNRASDLLRRRRNARSPFILQITQTTLSYTEPEELVALVKALGKKATVPFALHLDHGRSFEVCMRFLRLGVTSLMIDGSLQEDGKTPRTWEENVGITREVVAVAHAMGVTVEGEIGRLGQLSSEADRRDFLTDPMEAERFVNDTGVDMLAVAIGTTHGLFKGTPVIAHDRLAEIAEKVPIPLVMHGGSGVPGDAVRKAISLGVAKVNIDTHIRVAFYNALFPAVHQAEEEFATAEAEGGVRTYDIRKLLAPARAAMKGTVMDRMEVFGSVGKA